MASPGQKQKQLPEGTTPQSGEKVQEKPAERNETGKLDAVPKALKAGEPAFAQARAALASRGVRDGAALDSAAGIIASLSQRHNVDAARVMETLERNPERGNPSYVFGNRITEIEKKINSNYRKMNGLDERIDGYTVRMNVTEDLAAEDRGLMDKLGTFVQNLTVVAYYRWRIAGFEKDQKSLAEENKSLEEEKDRCKRIIGITSEFQAALAQAGPGAAAIAKATNFRG